MVTNFHVVFRFIVSFAIVIYNTSLYAQQIESLDSCGINDSCDKAILIPPFITGGPFVCIEGCNLNASPGTYHNPCGIGDFPTVWFKVFPDGNATLININVKSDDFEAPTISLFLQVQGCSNLQKVGLTQSNIACIIGSNGEAEAIGNNVGSNEEYYIAVSSFNSDGGHFELCVNTIGQGSACITSSKIEIKARSEGGSLDGPFFPGETVSVCMNVNSYTAVGNGCQWFHGLIPVFGNGWDPSSFDNGQPINATLNDSAIGVAGNGLYGAATWDWFTGIGYHHENTFFQIGDLDGNGTVDMCNNLYDIDCPHLGGIVGGCCGPCWSDAGDPLPPGWFAYGNNGTCPTLGPPPTLDWGDGKSCGGGMGPWHFCFDLKVRNYPECNIDPTTKDLTLGFFTTADGETGAWTGGPSVCSMDQPIKRTFVLQCPTQIDLGFEELPDVCNSSHFVYEISEPGVSHWTWEITPSWVVTDSIHEGDNGYIINSLLHNQLQTPVTVTYIFTGQDTGTQNTVIKKVRFRIMTPIEISFYEYPNMYTDSVIVCPNDTNQLIINAEVDGGTGNFNYVWWPSGISTPSIVITPPFHSTMYTVLVTDEHGCTATKVFNLIVDQNCVINHIEIDNDESNEDPTKGDPLPGGGFMPIVIEKRSEFIRQEGDIRIYPTPSKVQVMVEWSQAGIRPTKMFLYDTKGVVMRTYYVSENELTQKQLDLSFLDEGLYFVSLQSDNRIITKKIIKM